jgi:hypothetical protein
MTARYLCIKLLPDFPSTVTLDFGPHDQYFLSLTTLMARVRLHSLHNFEADRIGITAPYNSSIVLCVFVYIEMYFG